MQNLLSRLSSIADQGRRKGITFTVEQKSDHDVLVRFAYARRKHQLRSEMQAIDYHTKDLISAMLHAANMYNAHLHIASKPASHLMPIVRSFGFFHQHARYSEYRGTH